MKKSISFASGLMGIQARQSEREQQAFDWNKAAEIIREKLKDDPNLSADAGLNGDWNYTAGTIFEDGKPTIDNGAYLSSNWATPMLNIYYSDGKEEEFECYVIGNEKYGAESTWDDESLEILGIKPDEEK